MKKQLAILAMATASFGAQADDMALGDYHSTYLRDDGAVFQWGSLSPLGTGRSAVPVQLEGLSNIIEVAASGYNSLYLTGDGTVYVMGFNIASSPTPIDNLPSVVDVALTNGNAVFLTDDGSVFDYKLETGVLTDMGVDNATAIAADGNHCMALVGGVPYVWGHNEQGQAGLGHFDNVGMNPTPLEGLPTIVEMSPGTDHTLLIDTNREVWAFGSGTAGMLGDGGEMANPTPTKVPGLSNIKKVAGGRNQSLATDYDGNLFVFGWHNLITDTGLYNYSYTATRVEGVTGVENVSAGGDHSFVKINGVHYGWGGNTYGKLGNGNTVETHEFTPVDIPQPIALPATTASAEPVECPTPEPVEPAEPIIEYVDKIVEVEVIQYVDRDVIVTETITLTETVTQYIDKIVEVIKYVDKVVEVFVDKIIEREVIVDREVIKFVDKIVEVEVEVEVYRDPTDAEIAAYIEANMETPVEPIECATRFKKSNVYNIGDIFRFGDYNYEVLMGPIHGVKPNRAGHEHRFEKLNKCHGKGNGHSARNHHGKHNTHGKHHRHG